MSDNVNTGLLAMKPAIVKVVKHFEVCAICVDTGAVLDCMSWTSTATRVPKHSGDITVNPTGSGTSSGAFDKALKQFVKTHTVTANGKKSWKCEQDGKKGKNSKTGKLLPPIKNAFYQMWSPPDQTGMQWEDSDDSGEMVAQNTFRVHHIAPEAIGGGRFSPDLIEVLELMAANPGQAALKFTWLGEQDRTVAGVLFAGNPEVSTADIASYVVPDYRYGNDTTALVSVGITDYLLLNILDGLSSLVGTLAKGKGSVGVAAIANIDDCKGPAYLGEIPAEYVDFLLKGASIPEEEQQETIDALGYLILNMGA